MDSAIVFALASVVPAVATALSTFLALARKREAARDREHLRIEIKYGDRTVYLDGDAKPADVARVMHELASADARVSEEHPWIPSPPRPPRPMLRADSEVPRGEVVS